MDLTVVICTRNRDRILRRTLSSLECQKIQKSDWEVVVVNNGSGDDTAVVLLDKWKLSLLTLYEPLEGKSYALNRALAAVRGGVVVFTDDDMTFSESWLSSYLEVSPRFPQIPVFCGPIIPQFPPQTPDWLRHHPFGNYAFGDFAPDMEEGCLPPPILPFGGNFAVRASALRDMTFRVELGPSKANGPLCGEDSEFLRRFRKQGLPLVYTPKAEVRHWIRPEQIESAWLFGRAFYFGRTFVIDIGNGPPFVPRVPETLLHSSESLRITRGAVFNFVCGELFQLRLSRNVASERALWQAIDRRELESRLDLLVPAARNVLRSRGGLNVDV